MRIQVRVHPRLFAGRPICICTVSPASVSLQNRWSSDYQMHRQSCGPDDQSHLSRFGLKKSHFWWATWLDFMPGVHRLVACSGGQLRVRKEEFREDVSPLRLPQFRTDIWSEKFRLVGAEQDMQSWLEEVEVDDPLRWPLKGAAGRWSTFNLNIVTFLCEKQKLATDFLDFQDLKLLGLPKRFISETCGNC